MSNGMSSMLIITTTGAGSPTFLPVKVIWLTVDTTLPMGLARH